MRGSRIRGGQRGAGRLKAVLWLAILVSMVYVGIRVVPILYSEYLFQDAMQNTARFASVNRQTVEDIRASLLKEAKLEDLPVRPEDIHVESEAGNVRISASYSVTVDLQVYQWTLNFNPSANNNAI
jgi:predicted membrane protein